jgi:hypothetical protein
MSYKKNNSAAILIAISAIALSLVTTTSFNHSYTAFAAPKKDSGGGGSNSHANGVTTLGGSAATNTPNTNALTKKELSSLISCINTANKSQGLTPKVVTNFDTAKGITPASSTTTSSAATSSSPSLIAPKATPRA